MGRHKTISVETAPESSSSLADIEAGLREAFDAARAMVKQGDAPVQVLRELGGLGRAITTVQAEIRAQAKTREYTARNLPREVLMEALRLMKTDELAHIQREIETMQNTESVFR